MQTKLRMLSLLIVACLLWTCPTSAAPRKAESQQPTRDSKPRYVGVASWYGRQHQGRKMANGQRFDRHRFSAACWWFPLGTVIRVVNLENSKSVVVTITDRGPNHRLNRVLDLAEAAAEQLDYLNRGLVRVFFSPVVTAETQHAEIEAQWIPPSLNEASRAYGGSTSTEE
jgi:rare lipoprotein A